MRRSTALMSVAAVAFMASTAAAQAKTSFAGTWNMVVDSAAMAQQQAAGAGGGGRGGRGGGRGGLGATFTASKDDKTLTTSRMMGQNEVKSTYNLDGSDSKNQQMGRGGATEVVSHAKWDGSSLVITTDNQGPNGPVTTTMKLSVDASGNLWIESTRPGQNGEAMTTK